jgi:hypothetical protein
MIESLYSLVIMAVCLAIYFKTKDVERLSAHKGVSYFRDTFLFFAISYFFKFLTRIQIFTYRTLEILRIVPTATTTFVSIYASFMAVLYLTHSVTWRKGRDISNKEELLWHFIAIGAAGLTVFMNQPFFYIVAQIGLFVYALMEISWKDRGKKAPLMHTIYQLLMAAWMLNIIDLFTPNILLVLQLAIYLVSAGLFLIILYKVLRRLGAG